MKNFKDIMRAVGFIEGRLHSPVSIREAADAAGYSLYHFCRVFNELTGHSPYDYLMRRRLSEAAMEILHSERKILDVALDYQYSSPEAFSRAFRKMFGVLPNTGRIEIDPRAMILQAPLTEDNLRLVRRIGRPRPETVEREALRLVGRIVENGSKGPADCRAGWVRLQKIIPAIKSRVIPERLVRLFYYPMNRKPPYSWQLVGIKTHSLDETPMETVGKTLPAGTFARFRFEGSEMERELFFDYIFQTWLPKAACSLAEPYALAEYPLDLWERHAPSIPITVFIPIKREGDDSLDS